MAKTLAVVLIMLAAFLAGVPIALVGIAGAAYTLLNRRVKPEKVYREIDCQLLVLFSGLFVVIGGVETSGLARELLGLAAAAKARGATIFERSPAIKTTFGRKAADVITAGGRIHTARIVVATGTPTALFKSLARHFWFRSVYSTLTAPVPAKLRQQLGRRQTIVRDTVDPPHLIRWIDDQRLLVRGADGATPPARLRDKVIVQRTGQLMYELSTLYPDISGLQPEFGWSADYARTAEGLPYLGPHRNYPWHLFAFGDSSQGVTGAYLASRVLLRHYFEEMDPGDDVFAFTR